MPTLEDMERERKNNYFAELPRNAHRYNGDNRHYLFCGDDFTECCPNGDGTTVLDSGHLHMENGKYTEWASCPDCGCVVERKAKQKDIEIFKKMPKNIEIFGLVGVAC
jgi:hypothetical protein